MKLSVSCAFRHEAQDKILPVSRYLPSEERMSLVNATSLNPSEMKLVTKVVSKWCRKHHVSPYSDKGKAAMEAAIDRVRAGEHSSVILSEAIRSHMAVQHYKQHWE
jgi:ADP-ribosylglycohydrolase